MINNLMYIELKMGYSDDDPAWIGYVKTSKSRIKIFVKRFWKCPKIIEVLAPAFCWGLLY